MKYVVQWWYSGADQWMDLSHHFFLYKALKVAGKAVSNLRRVEKYRICKNTKNGLFELYRFERS